MSSCKDLLVETALSSPVREQLKRLKLGDELDVETDSTGGTVTLVALFQGKLVGTITSPEVLRIIDCISEGNKYRAVVLKVEAGLCKVRIHWVS